MDKKRKRRRRRRGGLTVDYQMQLIDEIRCRHGLEP